MPTQVCTNNNFIPVLGLNISIISIESAVDHIAAWATAHSSRYVSLCNVHVTVTTQSDKDLFSAVSQADMILPDGMPIAWAMRSRGASGQLRIAGPDLMMKCCERAAQDCIPVFFYGSTPQTLEKLQSILTKSYPELRVAGILSPPFRQQTDTEEKEAIAAINASGAGIVCVGLGCPKQELWMQKNSRHINGVLLGVGAAFDFAAQNTARAPMWMQRCGLEWLHRLASEPRRLWKRYLYTNTMFLYYTLFRKL